MFSVQKSPKNTKRMPNLNSKKAEEGEEESELKKTGSIFFSIKLARKIKVTFGHLKVILFFWASLY